MTSVVFLLFYCAIATALEHLVRPRTPWRAIYSPLAMLARAFIVATLWLFLLGIFADPLVATVASLLVLAVVLVVSNSKYIILGEPLVFLDFHLVGHTLRFPKLYYADVIRTPWYLAVGFVFIALAALFVPPLNTSGLLFFTSGQEVLWRLLLMLPLVGLIVAPRVSPLARQITRLFSGASGNLDPVQNTAACGLLVPLYAQYCRWVAEGRAPHAWSSRLPDFPHISRRSSPAPHIIAVQCESFVDPSRLSAPEHLRQSFRDACERSAFSGPLKVPAGGAYTMRSEFGFLSSLPEAELGTDRFNPYARAEKMNYPSLALTLREAGYRTEFVHPHDLRFFRRHLVLPALGFSHLHGDEAFAHAQRFGPHVGDLAVADYITRLLPASPDPRFVFAVTMENHGPWHRDRLADGEGSATELYLQHLRNSLEMIHRLQQLDLDRPLVLCFYGDHTPVLPGHFSPEQAVLTDYLIYHSDRRTTPIRKPAEVQNLSAMILRVAAPSDVHPSLTDLPLTSIAR